MRRWLLAFVQRPSLFRTSPVVDHGHLGFHHAVAFIGGGGVGLDDVGAFLADAGASPATRSIRFRLR